MKQDRRHRKEEHVAFLSRVRALTTMHAVTRLTVGAANANTGVVRLFN